MAKTHLHCELNLILKERKCLLDCLLPHALPLLRICDAFSNEEVPNALKIVDFSHSLDLRVMPRVSLPYNFPTAQTPHGQQLLAESSLPYQVSLYLVGHLNLCFLYKTHFLKLKFTSAVESSDQ